MPKRPPQLVLDALTTELSPMGFKCIKSTKTFVRDTNGKSERFHLIFTTHQPVYFVRPWAGIRYERVEGIFHRTSGFDSQGHQGTDTVGIDLVELWDLYADRNNPLSSLYDESSVPAIIRELLDIFHEGAQPFFARFSTLEALDPFLNEDPDRWRPYLECAKAIIVAKLVEREDFEKLATIYHAHVKRQSNGFYLPKFDALLDDLRRLEIPEK